MAEEKKNVPENELSDEKLENATGGTATRDGGWFVCQCCKTKKPVSDQSRNPDYCDYCYHYFIEPEENANFSKPPYSHKKKK